MWLKDNLKIEDNETYYKEKLHLDETIHVIKEELKKISVDLDKVNTKIRDMRGEFDSESKRDLYIYNRQKPKYQENYDKYSKILDNPYFARVDIKYEDEDNYNSFYISKTGFKKSVTTVFWIGEDLPQRLFIIAKMEKWPIIVEMV